MHEIFSFTSDLKDSVVSVTVVITSSGPSLPFCLVRVKNVACHWGGTTRNMPISSFVLNRHKRGPTNLYICLFFSGANPKKADAYHWVSTVLQAWPACRAILPFQTPLDRRGMASLAILATR